MRAMREKAGTHHERKAPTTSTSKPPPNVSQFEGRKEGISAQAVALIYKTMLYPLPTPHSYVKHNA